jgi:outer membrane murein-binding lipoprotein Lpp
MSTDNSGGKYFMNFRKQADVKDGKPGIWERIPVIWKIVGVLLSVAAMGGSAVATASQFVTQDDLAAHVAKESTLRAEIQSLTDKQAKVEADIAATRTDIAAIKSTADATREDIRLLTKFLLEQRSQPTATTPTTPHP